MYVSVPREAVPLVSKSPGMPSRSSLPSPPSSVSLPGPPTSTSFPVPPWITSSPQLPLIVLSSPGPPSITLGPFQSYHESARSPRFARTSCGSSQTTSDPKICGLTTHWFVCSVTVFTPASCISMHGAWNGWHA